MRISIFFFLVVFVVVNLSSCKKQQDDPDGKYTISGRLFAGTSDEPLANVPVELEGQREVAISKTEVYALGSTTTDASGFFSITYDQTHEDGAVKFENGNFVLLRTVQQVGGLIESLPWNKNVQRDFAQVDHTRARILVSTPEPINDTLFISAWGIISGDYLTAVNFNSIGIRNYLAVPPNELSHSNQEIFIKTEGGSDYQNTPRIWGIKYGVGRADMIKSLYAGFEDSIPDDYNIVEGKVRGFPFTDTIKLIL